MAKYETLKTDQTESENDPNTNLPRTISLGAVLARVRLAPHEIASLLTSWGQVHQGTAQDGISGKMLDAARAVVNPVSYGAEAPPLAAAVAPPADPAVAPVFENLHTDGA